MLKDPANAKIVADALRHFDGERYEMASFVVMPNHVHVLFRPLGDHALGGDCEVVEGIHGAGDQQANREDGRRFGRMSIGIG